MGHTEYHILSLGAGVQSTCVYLMGHHGELPLTHAVFADTGDEPEAVYRHLQWMDNLHSIPIYIISRGRLSDDLLQGKNSTGQRFASIPVFTETGTQKKDGTEKAGRLRRQCTMEYKIAPFIRCVRRDILGMKPRTRFKKDIHVHLYFGISADEARRTRGIIERYKGKPWATVHFPLIQQSMTRADCHRWMAGKVPHVVPRSACTYCPNRSDEEWKTLKATDQRGWDKAIQVDRALRDGTILQRKTVRPLYLHRSLQPLEQVDLDKPKRELPLFSFECEGMCGV